MVILCEKFSASVLNIFGGKYYHSNRFAESTSA